MGYLLFIFDITYSSFIQPLVVKPDQLIKHRDKPVKVNTDVNGVKEFIEQHMLKDIQIRQTVGKLRNFIIEPFVAHKEEEEAYVCIYSHRNGDTILFHHLGGVDIGDVDAKALRLEVPIDEHVTEDQIKQKLLINLSSDKQDRVAKFIAELYRIYERLFFTYLEINPLGMLFYILFSCIFDSHSFFSYILL